MRKEELFNIIGEVDEQKVATAGMAMTAKKKSRPVWLKWGAMAACLCLVIVGAFVAPTLINQTPVGDIDTSPMLADAAPMVCVNDALYKQSTKQTAYAELEEEFVYLGEIESEVINDQSISDGIPNKDFQANHPIVGSKVYQFGDDIVIKINGKYWLYEKLTNSAEETITFREKTFNKSDLSAETLEWLERYNSLTEKEQLAISSIPSDLYELYGYGETENSEVSGPTE